MKKILVQSLMILVFGYGIISLIGWIMSLDIPVPIIIIVFCYIVYRAGKEVING